MKEQKSHTDLLIVGAGPAGLLAAAWASRLKLNVRIIDDKLDRIVKGRADGLHVRSLEILDSFGLATPIMETGYRLREISSWNPRSDDPSKIERTERVFSREEDLGPFPQVGQSQAFIEKCFIGFFSKEGHVRVERNVLTESLRIDESLCCDHAKYPIRVTVMHQTLEKGFDERSQSGASNSTFHIVALLMCPDHHNGTREEINTKYLLGTDGAHSWVRKQVGVEMQGNKSKMHFGVMDIVPITNFPDARVSCAIHSARHGSVMTMPREDRLVRFYVQLAETGCEGEDEFRPEKVTVAMICEKASKVLHPYSLTYRSCSWWSVYTIGQQLASTFSSHDRIFLAGDAVHTHSPLMGAGMNVSMQDSYNILWKIGLVLKGFAQPSILRTYNDERHYVAQQLIDMDKRMSNFYTNGPGKDAQEYARFRDQVRIFISGSGVTYRSSVLTASDADVVCGSAHSISASEIAKANKIVPGARMPSCLVMSQSEANLCHVHDLLRSDGRWRLIILPGNIHQESNMERLQKLCDQLSDKSSCLHRYTPKTQQLDSVVEVLAIHAAQREDVELLNLPEILRPFDPILGYDYWKVYTDKISGADSSKSTAYQDWGVSEEQGKLVVIRPDQHVSLVCSLDEVMKVESFFARFMIPQRN